LKSKGPFTVFAPTNDAFAELPSGTVDTLLKPENKSALQGVLTYHVVPGKITAADLSNKIVQAGGMATLKTASGASLGAKLQGDKVVLVDEKGGTAEVTIANVTQSNGVIHVVDSVLLPNS